MKRVAVSCGLALASWLALVALAIVSQWSFDHGKNIVAFASGIAAVFVGIGALMVTAIAAEDMLQ